MIQLSKATTLNKFAFYPNILPASGSNLIFYYTQSYNQNSGSFIGQVISNPQNTPYVITEVAGALLPDATGQYMLYSYETIVAGAAIWNTTLDAWNLANTLWNAASGSQLGDQISEDRAWISGSDVVPITQYVSPDENGYYITYLG